MTKCPRCSTIVNSGLLMFLLRQEGHSKETEAMYYKNVSYEEAWSLMRSIILPL